MNYPKVSFVLEKGKDQKSPLILVNGFQEERKKLIEKIRKRTGKDFSLLFFSGMDWNGDLTPYPAKSPFKGGEDFPGKGKDYLDFLLEKRNSVLKENDIVPSYHVIAGYSLAGLFALYSMIAGKSFDAAVSASGSLWYPGFEDFIQKAELEGKGTIYLSLGDKEKETHNPAMKTVEEKTLAIAKMLKEKGQKVFFESNSGNHFQDPEGRLAKGIGWILENRK